MNIDLLPFSAFALESCPPVARTTDSHTLTLQLALATEAASPEAMEGTASLLPGTISFDKPLRAAVVPADESALIITF
jgi:hypothetical protein